MQAPEPLSHEDGNGGKDTGLEDQNVQRAAILEIAGLVAFGHWQSSLIVCGPADADKRRAIVWADVRHHRTDLRKADRHLSNEAMPFGSIAPHRNSDHQTTCNYMRKNFMAKLTNHRGSATRVRGIYHKQQGRGMVQP